MLYVRELDQHVAKSRRVGSEPEPEPEPEPADDLTSFHSKTLKKSIRHFNQTANFGDAERKKVYLKSLETEILKHFETVFALNEAKILNLFHRAKEVYGDIMDTR